MTAHKTRFQQIRENNLTQQQAAPEYDINAEQYPVPGNVRHLCFAWPDGQRLLLNYAYLAAVQFLPEESCIVLTFTTHKITIKGLRLEDLFAGLMDQLPRIISCVEERYLALADEDEPVVAGIIVLVNE